MSAAPQAARALSVASGAARPPPPPTGRVEAPARLRRIAARLGDEWLPRAAWTISRTGRPGLLGLALLLATALFLLSTHLRVVAEVESLRNDLAVAKARTRPEATGAVADSPAATSALPARTEMPAMLRKLLDEATRARLAVDTAQYDLGAASGSGVVRYQVAFPVTGPYPQIRAFIDTTLAKMPAVSLSDLALERRSIASGAVEAQIRLTVHAAATGASARVVAVRWAEQRVVAPTHAAALFAQHSWYVAPPPRPPPPPQKAPPPPEPTAPPLPYKLVGRYAPGRDAPVFFLVRGDRVIDARVGDRIDGVYQLESAAADKLVFVYLPLQIRQTLAAGVSK